MSANVSAVPSTNSATSTMTMLTASLTIVTARTARMAARTRLTAAMSRTRSTRSATTPACTPNSSTGRFWASAAIDTRNGSRVWLATSSGPAASAIPSPMLVMTDATSSRRNPRPSREGAIRSATTVNGDGTPRGYRRGQRLGTVPTWSVTMPPVRPRQWTSTRPASPMISAIRSGDGYARTLRTR